MSRDLTLLTATADCPIGFHLVERYMARQSVLPRIARWIVADDGWTPVDPTAGQTYIRRTRPPETTPVRSYCDNLVALFDEFDREPTEFLAFVEDDDLYHPRHLEVLLDHLDRPGVLAAGDDVQRYYNVALRRYHVYDNWRGASLYTMGIRREAVPIFRDAVERCHRCDAKGIDAEFWDLLTKRKGKPSAVTFQRSQAVGIKGLPGRTGIGIGHHPEQWGGDEWPMDSDGSKLREWAGDQAGNYFQFYEACERAAGYDVEGVAV